jgi:hypothetical protein
LSLVHWISPGDWLGIHILIGSSPSTRWYNHPTHSYIYFLVWLRSLM